MTSLEVIPDQITPGEAKRPCGICKEAKINRKGQDVPSSSLVVTFFGTLTLIEGHFGDGGPF